MADQLLLSVIMGHATYLNTLQEGWPTGESTTSPHHHQSNGLAEVYVKIIRTILQKGKDANEDPHFAMMAYRTTPIGPNTPSPMELIHQCRPKGDLPIANAALRAKGIVVETAKSIKVSLSKNKLFCAKPLQRKSGKRPKW